MFFDAEPVDDVKKKRKAASGSAPAAAAEKKNDANDSDQPGPSKPTKGRKKK